MSETMLATCIEELEVGDRASVSKVMTNEGVGEFASLSLDFNPVHFDRQYVERTVFKKPIVHGLLVASLFSGLLGTKCPGTGAIYLSQTLKFVSPVWIGEEVTATVEILHINSSTRTVTLSTIARVGNRVVIEGAAVVKCPSRKKAV